MSVQFNDPVQQTKFPTDEKADEVSTHILAGSIAALAVGGALLGGHPWGWGFAAAFACLSVFLAWAIRRWESMSTLVLTIPIIGTLVAFVQGPRVSDTFQTVSWLSYAVLAGVAVFIIMDERPAITDRYAEAITSLIVGILVGLGLSFTLPPILPLPPWASATVGAIVTGLVFRLIAKEFVMEE